VLERYWHWAIGYWWYLPVLGPIGTEWYFYWLWWPIPIPIRQQLALSTG